ncbi:MULTISPECIES: hypothetical protein [Luteimonas]|uniref:hypothetical protein n=1 Tax=Luteimonas TaxID=83614 RepID=UPI000C7AA9A3|nr:MULTISPECIES: hypothetical protein [Luteimonas]
MAATDKPESATNPDQPEQADHVAVNDRKSSKGDRYAHDNNAYAEGNDPALTAGKTRIREVPSEATRKPGDAKP